MEVMSAWSSPTTDRVSLGLIAAAHLFVDLCQGVVVAMLPFLVAAGDITYAAGGGLVFAASASSSILQPLFGHLADRLSSRWLLPGSVLFTGLALAAASQASVYAMMVTLLAVSGLGVAAFHPEAARQARRAAGVRAALGMSLFAVGGGIGFALGPSVTAGLMTNFGRVGLGNFFAPATVVVAAFLLWRFGSRTAHSAKHSKNGTLSGRRDAWGAFAFLSVLVMARSVAYIGCNAFLALYWMQQFGVTAAESTNVLSVFLGAGIFGTLLGGFAGERFAHRPVIWTGFLLAAIILPFVLMAPARWALVLLVPFAMSLSSPWGVMMVMAQEYLPARIGMASGVTLGLSVSFGGIFAPILGQIADEHGTAAVMTIIEVVLACVAVLVFFLPNPRRVEAEENNGSVA